jgi:hypothetical protein
LILDIKMEREKFSIGIIVTKKLVHREQIFRHVGNTKDIVKKERMRRTSNLGMTSMSNMQTCTVGDLHGVLSIVAFLEAEAVQIGRQVVRRAGVEVPVAVAGVVGVGDVGVARARLVRLEGVVEAVAAAEGVVAVLATHLASWARATASIAATSIGVAASASSANRRHGHRRVEPVNQAHVVEVHRRLPGTESHLHHRGGYGAAGASAAEDAATVSSGTAAKAAGVE